MIIRVFASPDAAGRAAARRLADAIREQPGLVLGLPTGRTPVPTYAELVRLYEAGAVDFSRVRTFNLDEFAGVAASHPGSFRHFMHHHLFRGINLHMSHVEFLDGMAANLDAECERYETAIERAGGIDVQVLGLGANGHLGFNEPGETLTARTHRVQLHEVTRRENAALFGGDQAAVPLEALSMGMGTIFKARTIVLLATGRRKAACIERTVHGPLTTQLPASFLQTHRDVEIYLDRDAAAMLVRT